MILRMVWLTILSTLALLPAVLANNGTRYVSWLQADGTTVYLDDNRKPALYTQDFGDCQGSSAINVTRFDAAYYQDNMTINFHVVGNSQLVNESVMLYIGVYAYGASRFDLTFNPCMSSIYSMCPVRAGVEINAGAAIPVSQKDVSSIPDIALSIPDFEGQAILRIFSNKTSQQIACYSAVISNGSTFSQPAGLGTVLGLFALTALIASFATAAYGEAVPTMRLHYAHSLSVGVVFAVFQHIFFTGALSMNWPSVLVAWFSNFAWSGGMIYTKGMQDSISRLLGNNIGSTAAVGAAAAGQNNPTLGGGYNVAQIYGRGMPTWGDDQSVARDIARQIYDHGPGPLSKRMLAQKAFERVLRRRDEGIADTSSGFKWYGNLVRDGLPLPGNYSGFAGTLAQENLQISNAFLTGFLWLLILILTLIGTLALFKGILELFARRKWMPETRLSFFRTHWLRYMGAIVLRTCFIAWFMIMFLTIFQFTFQSPASVKAIATIVFMIFLIGLSGLAVYACLYKGKRDNNDDPYNERKGVLAKLGFGRNKSTRPVAVELQTRPENKASGTPFWRRTSSRMSVDAGQARYSIHDDETYIMKFGWLASRFRRTRWWFFVFWLFYEFVRACFYAGASGHPLIQVFGLLVVEILAFGFVLWAKPFEGKRLNVLVVYCLGFSKVTTVALSAAFDIQFNLDRIITTAIGIVIIVIQGILMIITCIAIAVGAITSYMSVSRNTNDFRPRKYKPLREKYFDHLDRAVNDLPPEPKAPKEPKIKRVKTPEPEPVEPYFEMKTMRRVAKIEDDNVDDIAIIEDPDFSQPFPPYAESRPASSRGYSGPSRARTSSAGSASLGHGSLPFGARPHRPSWSTRDNSWNNEERDIQHTPVDMTRNVSEDVIVPRSAHVRVNSHGSTSSRRMARRQASSDDMRARARPRAGSHGSSGRTTPVHEYERPGKMPMLTPAQESEEFTSYFDHFQQKRQA